MSAHLPTGQRPAALKSVVARLANALAAMDRHAIAHAVLTAAYGVTTVVLYVEGAVIHAICALIMSVTYATLCRPPPRH